MDEAKKITEYQDELFNYLEEFFIRVTGQTVNNFGPLEEFSTNIKKNPKKLARRMDDSFRWLDKTIRPFYANKGMSIYPSGTGLGGYKLVMGGSGRFSKAHIDSIQKVLLYADTILIPDPFLAWIETSREGERFPTVSLLEAALLLLQLKPVIDAKLPFPAIFVFPSWDKLLEEQDMQTLQEQLSLVVDVFAFFVNPSLQSIDDVKKFVSDNPKEFLEQVEKHRLFVAPGGHVGESVAIALRTYEDFISNWRSCEFVSYFLSLTTAQKVLTGIMERLGPQQHLLENIRELKANPLICLEAHSHYFKLVTRTNGERLVRLSLLDNKQLAIMDALSSREFTWLSKVPIKDLIELRQNNENALFRERLRHIAERLDEAELSQINTVTIEIMREIDEMVLAHEKEVSDIQERYSRKFGKTAVLAWASFGGCLIPSLAPYLGIVAPICLLTQYLGDKADKKIDLNKTSKSLFGVLANVKRITAD